MTDTREITPVYVNIADAARLAGLSLPAMRRAVDEQALRTASVDGRTLIAMAELDRWVASQIVRARQGRRP